MLSGERPLNGSNAQAIMAKRFTETARALRTVRAAVPENIERAVAKAMSTDPSGRYTTAAQFALALSSTSLGTPNDTMELAPAPVSAAKSVAVLPFADMSADKDNEYFTDGMAEEIIDALSKIQSLRLTSRSTVLEGSVRKVGNRLRIAHSDPKLALIYLERAIRADPTDPNRLYNMACTYPVIGGRSSDALDALEQAAKRGSGYDGWIEHDSDLDSPRQEPRYLALLQSM